MFALWIPLLGVILTRLIAAELARGIAVAVVIVPIISYNLGTLVIRAGQEAVPEHQVQASIYAGLRLLDDYPGLIPDDAVAHDYLRGALSAGDLVKMRDQGWIDEGPYTPQELLDAEVNLLVQVLPVTSPMCRLTPVSGGALDIRASGSRIIRLPTSADLQLAASRDQLTSGIRSETLAAGDYRVVNISRDTTLQVDRLPAGSADC